MKLQRTVVGLIVFFLVHFSGAELLNEVTVGYTVQLPDGWTVDRKSTTQHIFYDTTDTYFSEISILRHDFESAVTYSTSDEWTIANFIAYTLLIDSDLLSVLVFSDTVTSFQNGTLRAADAYSYFFDPDTSIGDWAEYIRFTATGTRGYEIYALGPMEDMEANVSTYADIIESITLLDTADIINRVVSPMRHSVGRRQNVHSSVNVHDLLGRSVRVSSRALPNGLFIRPERTLLQINR